MMKRLTTTILTAILLLFSVNNALAQCDFTVTDSQPFIEDFEGTTFECWTVETVGAGNWTTMAGSGTTLAAFSFTNVGDEARLISPVLDISGVAGATFSFSYAMMGLYDMDELVVSYRSSETDSWHTLGTYSVSDYQNFFEETFTLTDLSATYQVSFLGRGLGGYMIFVDNIEIAGEGGCARPVSLNATDISASSALLGWATPVTFKTLCDVIVVTDDEPYFDDFEASDNFVCWQTEIVSGIDNWVIDPGYLIVNNTAFSSGWAARQCSSRPQWISLRSPTLS